MSSIFNGLSPRPGLNAEITARQSAPDTAGVASDVHAAALVSDAATGAEEGGRATGLNAELIAALPQSRLEAFLPATQDAAPELPVHSILDTFASLSAGPWRDTPRGGKQYGGELIRHESLKQQALGGAREADSEVAIGPAAIAHNLAQRARQAGLSYNEAARLEKIIRDGQFEGDAALLATLLETGNAADALRTFLDLQQARLKRPDCLTPDVVRALTLGVGLARSNESREGILSRASALSAVHALVEMSFEDAFPIGRALAKAGTSVNVDNTNPAADAVTERALILKAIAARDAELSKSENGEKFTLYQSESAHEILLFAANIRGEDAQRLIEITSAIDLDGDGMDEALQQKWQNASAPAVLQMLHAEYDPIYAWSMHTPGQWFAEKVPVTDVAEEQASMLEMAGVEAIKRGDERGGNSGMVLATMVNAETPRPNEAYKRIKVDSDNRAKALDDIESIVRDGIDVAIALSPTPGERHAMAITDVRGSGSSREFLITDPWTGRTKWVMSADILNGNIGGNAAAFTDYWF